jgi:hypothetical protein
MDREVVVSNYFDSKNLLHKKWENQGIVVTCQAIKQL